VAVVADDERLPSAGGHDLFPEGRFPKSGEELRASIA
jgi:hypothetical protein